MPMTTSRPHAEASTVTSPFTIPGGHIHRWKGKRPIWHVAIRPNQSRLQHNRAEYPLSKTLKTVQTNRATLPPSDQGLRESR